MTVLIFQRIVPHYRIPIFNSLSKRLDLVVCHGKEISGSSLKDESGNLGFPHFHIKNWYLSKKKETWVIQNIFTPIFRFKPTIVVAEFGLGILSNWLLLYLRTIFGYKLMFWSHGYNWKKGFHPNYSISDKLRLWLINASDGIILYSQNGRKTLSKWVRFPDRLYVASNTLDTGSLLKLRKGYEKEGKEILKKKCGIEHFKLIIFIGRLKKDKQVDFLLRVFSYVLKHIEDCGLLVVGDGPERENLKNLSKLMRLRNVYFLGEIKEMEKAGKLLFISDVLVNPGDIGLSVVHAFCFDMPVITQKSGVNGPCSPEFEYIENGKTGFLCEIGNVERMAEIVIKLLENEKIREKLKRNIRQKILKDCSIEAFLQCYIQAVKKISKR